MELKDFCLYLCFFSFLGFEFFHPKTRDSEATAIS